MDYRAAQQEVAIEARMISSFFVAKNGDQIIHNSQHKWPLLELRQLGSISWRVLCKKLRKVLLSRRLGSIVSSQLMIKFKLPLNTSRIYCTLKMTGILLDLQKEIKGKYKRSVHSI